MKATPRLSLFILMVCTTVQATSLQAAEPGADVGGTVSDYAAGRAVLQDTAGYAVAEPFGPTIHLDGTFGDGLGYNDNYYGVQVFVPRHLDPGRSLFFSALAGSMTDEGDFVGNIGQGYRHYLKCYDRILGISGWIDYDETHRDDYSRFGVSLESLGKYLDMRINGYVLFDDDVRTVFDGFVEQPFFLDNRIMLRRRTVNESPYSMIELEVGGPIPFLARRGVYGYAGVYGVGSPEEDDAIGVQGRVDVAATDDLSIGVRLSNDDVFGFVTQATLSLILPDGKPSRFFKPRTVKERLQHAVVRRDRVAVRTEQTDRPVPAINPFDNEPFFVFHVDPNTGKIGDGTFERPFGSMELLRLANNAGVDIIRVIPRTDGTGINLAMGGNLPLFDRQRLLGTSVMHSFTAVQGTFTLPGFTGAGPGPLISNSVITAGGNVVQLADMNEVSGFTISASDTGNGIANIVPITDFDINRNVFIEHVNAVALANATGTGRFDSNTITGTPNIANDGFQLTNTAVGVLNLSITNNTATLNEGNGFNVNANTAGAVINATVTGNIANANGTGYFIGTAGGTINIDFDNNTADGNTATTTGANFTSTGGTINITSLSGNIFTDNVGTNLAFNALTGAGGGTIIVNGFTANTITGAGTGNTTATPAHGVLARADGATSLIDMDMVSNTITGNGAGLGGGHGVSIETTNAGTVLGSIIGNTISSNPGGMGVSVLANTGTVDFGSVAGRVVSGNLFDANVDAGFGARLQSTATASFDFVSNTFTNTTDGSNAAFGGEGLKLRTEDASILAVARIFGNRFGVNAAGTQGSNASHGGQIEMFQMSQAPDVDVLSNTSRFNGGDGFNITRNADAFLDDVVIASNLFDANTGNGLAIQANGGDNNIVGGGALIIDVTVNAINRFTNNGASGAFLHSAGDADLRVTLDNNIITGNTLHGVDGQTEVLSQLLGVWSDNTIASNGDDGISLVEINRLGVGPDVDINDNLITGNADDGFHLTGRGLESGASVVDLNRNIITSNGGDGAEVETLGVDLLSASDATVNFVDNTIGNNAQTGIEMYAEWLTSITTTSSGNTIEFNGDDGWSITTSGVADTARIDGAPAPESHALVTALLTDNIIRFNAARGIDLLNQWDSRIDIAVIGTVDPRPTQGAAASSLIDSNGLQGIMAVNFADRTLATPFSGTNRIFFNDILMRVFQTSVRGNGTNAVTQDDGNGVYVRVGTNFQFETSNGLFNAPGLEAGSETLEFGVFKVALEDNHFAGNFGTDVVTESFVATAVPPITNPVNADGTFNPAFVEDPTARLDFRITGNVGHDIDVTRFGAFYESADPFKSVHRTPTSRFDDINRRRNAQRDPGFLTPIAPGLTVAAVPAPAVGAFAATAVPVATDGFYNGAFVDFLTGANAPNGIRSITAFAAATLLFTTDAFPVAPAAGDTFDVISPFNAGIGVSTFHTEAASVATFNTFDNIVSDFGSAFNLADPTNDPDEILFPFTWATGFAFGAPFPPGSP